MLSTIRRFSARSPAKSSVIWGKQDSWRARGSWDGSGLTYVQQPPLIIWSTETTCPVFPFNSLCPLSPLAPQLSWLCKFKISERPNNSPVRATSAWIMFISITCRNRLVAFSLFHREQQFVSHYSYITTEPGGFGTGFVLCVFIWVDGLVIRALNWNP